MLWPTSRTAWRRGEWRTHYGLRPRWNRVKRSLCPGCQDLWQNAAKYAIIALGDAVKAWRNDKQKNRFPRFAEADSLNVPRMKSSACHQPWSTTTWKKRSSSYDPAAHSLTSPQVHAAGRADPSTGAHQAPGNDSETPCCRICSCRFIPRSGDFAPFQAVIYLRAQFRAAGQGRQPVHAARPRECRRHRERGERGGERPSAGSCSNRRRERRLSQGNPSGPCGKGQSVPSAFGGPLSGGWHGVGQRRSSVERQLRIRSRTTGADAGSRSHSSASEDGSGDALFNSEDPVRTTGRVDTGGFDLRTPGNGPPAVAKEDRFT